MAERQREIWVDNIKTIACILVVIGHLLQGLIMAGIIKKTDMYIWFNQTIYIFHVALFFVCSGYLYQLNSDAFTWKKWVGHILNKLISLGVPYFFFSILTWSLKTIFSTSVNNQVESLLIVLFRNPLSPYWYLFCLTIIYSITIKVMNSKQMLLTMIFAIFLKSLALIYSRKMHPIIYMVCSNEVWFVAGMCLKFNNITTKVKKKIVIISYIGVCVFIASTWILRNNINEITSFVLCILICFSLIVIEISKNKKTQLVNIVSKYFMPIFLMHTLISAPIRIFLLHFQIKNSFIHLAVGLLSSFLGPILVMKIIEKMKWPIFFIYPTRISSVSRFMNR